MENLETAIARLDQKIDAIATDLDAQWNERIERGKQGFISASLIITCGLLAYHHAVYPMMQGVPVTGANPLSAIARLWNRTGDAVSGYPGDAVAQAARQWEGKQFKPGVSAQCAVFVRYVFAQLGLSMPVTKQPVDGLPPGTATANGFYGSDVGLLVKDADRFEVGMVVIFGCTYGGYSCSTATHVGILTHRDGDGEWWMIDRPTAHGKVRHRKISTFPVVLGAVRPNTQRIEK